MLSSLSFLYLFIVANKELSLSVNIFEELNLEIKIPFIFTGFVSASQNKLKSSNNFADGSCNVVLGCNNFSTVLILEYTFIACK